MRPHSIPAKLDGHKFREVTIGCTTDQVFRLSKPDQPIRIAKVSTTDRMDDLHAEAKRLRWLKSVDVPAPRVLDVIEHENRLWLVTERLPGANIAESEATPETKVREIAGALRTLHAIDPDTCPFDESLNVKLARARDNVRLNKVDETDFHEDVLGLSAVELFDQVEKHRPHDEDIVVTHGDASLPNFMLDGERFAGWVDCGRLGRADRYQDLAIAARSIERNLGKQWVAPLFQAYGVSAPAPDRLEFYRHLDEFF